VLTTSQRKTSALKHTSKELGLQVHGIERVDSLVIVGFDLTCKEGNLVSFCSSNSLPNGIVGRCAG
jgi:hypothetical protein